MLKKKKKKKKRWQGRWEKGMQSGFGKLIDDRRETVYEGQWIRGARHGQGLLRSQAGRERMTYNHSMLMHLEELLKKGGRMKFTARSFLCLRLAQ